MPDNPLSWSVSYAVGTSKFIFAFCPKCKELRLQDGLALMVAGDRLLKDLKFRCSKRGRKSCRAFVSWDEGQRTSFDYGKG